MRLFLLLCIVIFLAACTGNAAEEIPPSPQVISKVLATVYITPTPNAEQAAATQRAITPTPQTPTPTVPPTRTPYVGVFIGRVQAEGENVPITAPLFEPEQIQQPAAQDCEIPISREYVPLLNDEPGVAADMGCPIQQGFGFFGQVQVFERGAMYRRTDTREVWAIVPDRERFWYVDTPEEENTVGISPVAGLVIPTGDFASVWVGVDDLRTRIGYAVEEEQRAAIGIQRFDGGTLLFDQTSGLIFSLLVDGNASGPFTAPERSELPTLEPQITPSPAENTPEVETP